MIGRGWRINPALWGWFHYPAEDLAREFQAIAGWEFVALTVDHVSLTADSTTLTVDATGAP